MKPEVAAEALNAIFSEFGTIVDVVAKRNLKAKGQAFVVFENPEAALNAIEAVQGFELFGKQMKVALARSTSDKTIELQGTKEDYETHRRHRQADRGMARPPSLLFAWTNPGRFSLVKIKRKHLKPRKRRGNLRQVQAWDL